MTSTVHKKDTYLNWKYVLLLFTIPLAFYFASLQENISAAQHFIYIGIILVQLFAGIMGTTERFQPLKVYGYLYLISGLLFAYLGLVFFW
ncbi:hypothetical protein [Thalassobacillus sp. CUG 92003]|uniref:hypothetical protein n=1 Tax=Thalassobacillus sp. CUG 92003 TaxID=2736641 RepID=UPI0015E6F012|nr:hypothetical protein [Thalassobacillus sp. CUG 92003]